MLQPRRATHWVGFSDASYVVQGCSTDEQCTLYIQKLPSSFVAHVMQNKGTILIDRERRFNACENTRRREARIMRSSLKAAGLAMLHIKRFEHLLEFTIGRFGTVNVHVFATFCSENVLYNVVQDITIPIITGFSFWKYKRFTMHDA